MTGWFTANFQTIAAVGSTLGLILALAYSAFRGQRTANLLQAATGWRQEHDLVKAQLDREREERRLEREEWNRERTEFDNETRKLRDRNEYLWSQIQLGRKAHDTR